MVFTVCFIDDFQQFLCSLDKKIQNNFQVLR